MSGFDQRSIGEAVRVAGEDTVDIGSKTDTISSELTGERHRYSIAGADGKSESGIGDHLSVEEWYLSVLEGYGDGIRSEAVYLGIALDDDGSSVDRDDREAGSDQYLRDGSIERLVRTLRSERCIDFQRIGTGAVAEVEIMGELMAGGSGAMDKDEAQRLLVTSGLYRKRYLFEERGTGSETGTILVSRDAAADLENDEGWRDGHRGVISGTIPGKRPFCQGSGVYFHKKGLDLRETEHLAILTLYI